MIDYLYGHSYLRKDNDLNNSLHFGLEYLTFRYFLISFNLALFLQRNSALILLLDILLQRLLQSLIIQGCRFDTHQHQYNNLH